jgi:hypothetical protein
LRAGTLRKVILKRPGKVNSPMPRELTEPNITDSSVLSSRARRPCGPNNLGNLWRRLALPAPIGKWSLTS